MVRQIIILRVNSKANMTTRKIQRIYAREHNHHLAARHVVGSGYNLRDWELLPPVVPRLFVSRCMRKHRPGITRIREIGVSVDKERDEACKEDHQSLHGMSWANG
jgi:hypothetical protein